MSVCKHCYQECSDDDFFCPADGELLKKDFLLKNKYIIKEKIGGGGMGFVYEAEHSILKNKVAIKILKPDFSNEYQQAKNRFLREAHIMAQLEHKNIIRIIDYDSDFSYAFFVMEYLDGETLEKKISNTKTLSFESISFILTKVCQAISYAHQNSILHRDLKPSNIFLSRGSGQEGEVKVLDFGIAKILNPEETKITKTNEIIGTFQYMSPEQMNAENIDARSDIYSMGIILYEMLCGNTPYKTFSKSVSQGGREVSSEVETIVQKALAERREDRQQNIMELSNEFESAILKQNTKSVEDNLQQDEKRDFLKGGINIKIDNRKKNVFKKKVEIGGDFNN